MSSEAARRFRGSPAWKKARAMVVAKARRDDVPCGICGGSIWWDAPRRHRSGPSVDHEVPLKTLDLGTAEGRRLAVDPSRLRITHVGCNSSRENASRGGYAGAAYPSSGHTVTREVLVPVCNGRACYCAWMGDGEPREGCSSGPPEMVSVRVPAMSEKGESV